MKRLITFFFLFIAIISANAQISFNIVKQDVTCNRQDLGNAEVNVISTNPPYSYLWNTNDTTNSISNLYEGNYSVVITDGLGNDTTVNIQILLRICEMAPEIVFTPNNDGINDSWSIQNYEYFPESKVMVFNRLGQIVFQHSGLYQDWDGKDLFGIPVPDASYYYVVYHDKKDDGTIIKGCITILK